MIFKNRALAAYIVLIAFLFRFGLLVVIYPGKEKVNYWEDVTIAINFLEGKGYSMGFSQVRENVDVRPTAIKPPVYPLLISLLFFVFGFKNFFPVFLLHSVLGALTCLFLFLFVRRFSHKRAFIASMGFAIYPPFVYHAISVPESSTIFLFLLSVFLYLVSDLNKQTSAAEWCITAAVGGLLGLNETVAMPFVIVSFFYVAYLSNENSAKKLRNMFFAISIISLVISPWLIRNYIVFDRFPLFRTGIGANLFLSMRNAEELPEEITSLIKNNVEESDEVSEDKFVSRIIVDWIKKNPEAYVRTALKNFLNFWWETDKYRKNHTLQYLVGRKIPYVMLFFLSLPALLVRLYQIMIKPKIAVNTMSHYILLFTIIISYSLIYTLFGAHNLRYHFPVQLTMFVFLSETLVIVFNYMKRHWLSYHPTE